MATEHGAALLRGYLKRSGLSLYAFCRDHDFDRIALSRLLKQERKRVTVQLALKIARATSGAVPVESWEVTQ